MIGNLDYAVLQNIWWVLVSLTAALFLFLTFVQGGQTLLWQVSEDDMEKSLIINALGMKWELAFTTLVLFGGALFAAFPKFYATSFGGAYWLWILILLTFVIQAVSYEFRKKPGNLLGAGTYEFFLFINGAAGVFLIGAAAGTFFTGANFTLNAYNQASWGHPLRGLEALFSPFNLSLGLFLVFNARVLGAMYLVNAIDFNALEDFEKRLRRASFTNFVYAFPFLLYVFLNLLLVDGYGYDENGTVSMVAYKYLKNLLAMPSVFFMLLGGFFLVVWGVVLTSVKGSDRGIWCGGAGTVLVGLAVFFTAGFNNTAFYPSKIDLQSSLTVLNASSTRYTLTVMTYAAIAVPFVLGYIAYVWRLMNARKLKMNDVTGAKAY